MLSIIVFLPLVAAIACAVVPASRPTWPRWIALVASRGEPRARDGSHRRVRARRRHAVRREVRVGAAGGHRVPPRRRRPLAADGVPLGAAHGAGGARQLEHRQEAAVLVRDADASGRGHERRVHGPRLHPVLRVLGARARPDVLPHRPVGRPEARVRSAEVLPLHAARLGVHAARHHRALPVAAPRVPRGPST